MKWNRKNKKTKPRGTNPRKREKKNQMNKQQ